MKILKSNFIWIFTVVLTATLSSCSFDPIDQKYDKHTADDDYRRIKEISGSVDSIEKVLLAKYMIEHGLVSPHVLEAHATYRELLEEAKAEKEKYEIEKRKKGKKEIDIAKSHENEKIRNIKKVLFVDFVEQGEDEGLEFIEGINKPKKATPPTNPNLIVYDVMFKNISEKDIRAFKGNINFYDIFHNEIKRTTFTNFKQVNAGDSIVHRFTIDLKEIGKGANTYKDLKKDFIKVEWMPDRLIHTDDEVIE